MKVARPAKRLKPFFWNKLNNTDVTSTVWSESSVDAEFVMEDLEATFTIDNTPSTPSQITSPTRKQNVTTLLDITRANNIAIMLSRFKFGFSDIRQALLDLDDSRLTVDDLKAISKQLPTPEEITRIKDFGDASKLAKADRYFYEIMTIPRLPERLESMVYRQKLELDIEEIRPDLQAIREACKELRTSVRFKRTLRAILAVGNALNGSSFRGGAYGFRLEALVKIKETKTAKGGPECPTLLHYVARVLMRTDPNLTLFIDELPNLESAARISFQTVAQSVQSLVVSLGKVKEEIQLLKQLRHPSSNDQFVAVMQPFVAKVTENVDALKKMADFVETDLRGLFSYYGESLDSPDGLKPEEFFGMICSFSSSLQKAAVEVYEAQQKLLASKPELIVPETDASPAIKAVPDSPATSLAVPAGGERQDTPKSIGRGDADEAIRTLKEGRTRRARPPRSIARANKIFLDGGRPESRIFTE
ncbi:FH2-domain-containing protein [Leucogyrophana mollusca]|uniref:FH2-domain-containing protein n=1 Tax=Leucogyrophana mollusca TaxID=85980 RepID=A0ACB8BC15_9AGAM|nr:FH2-domain-containing protein [Leucogyrophana mollusca]